MLKEIAEYLMQSSAAGKEVSVKHGDGSVSKYVLDAQGESHLLGNVYDNKPVHEEVLDLQSLIVRTKTLINEFDRFQKEYAVAFFGQQSVVVVLDAYPITACATDTIDSMRKNVIRIKLVQSKACEALTRLHTADSWSHKELCQELRSHGLCAAELEGFESISITSLKNSNASEDGLSKSVRATGSMTEELIPDTATFRIPIYSNGGFNENRYILHGFSFNPSYDSFSIHQRDDFARQQEDLLKQAASLFEEKTGVQAVLGTVPNPSLIGE